MSTPFFTVITTTYNRAPILSSAIESVLQQSFTDYEYLVIDNGSTDDTREIVQRFKDERLCYIQNPSPSLSCDAPRNLGIERARGEWVAFLDDDDRWYSHKLECVKRTIDLNPNIAVVCHHELKKVYGVDRGIIKYGPWKENFYEKLLYEGNCLSPSAISIQTDVLRKMKGFRLGGDIDGAADYELWLRIAKEHHPFHFIDEVLGECNLNQNNMAFKDRYFALKTAWFVKEHILEYEGKSFYRISKKGGWRILKLYLVALRSLLLGNIRKQ